MFADDTKIFKILDDYDSFGDLRAYKAISRTFNLGRAKCKCNSIQRNARYCTLALTTRNSPIR